MRDRFHPVSGPGPTPCRLSMTGDDLALEGYRVAIAEGYRFYSYGDAMVVL